MAVSQRIGWRVLFGADATDELIAATRAVLLVTSADFELRLNHPVMLLGPSWLPTRARQRLRRAVRELDQIAYGLIARCRRGEIDGGDLLGPLLAAQRSESWLTDRLVRDNLVTLIVDSRENPGLLLTWALYELARHPDVAPRASAEARRLLARGIEMSPSSLAHLPTVDAVLLETLRLHPPAYAVGRQALRDCTIAGASVRRGTIVLLSQFVTHVSPTSFREPGTFRPDRWLDGETAGLASGAYTPFGLGPRRCPGEGLARRVGLVGLAVMLAELRFDLLDPAPIEPTVRLSLRPSRAVRLRVRREAMTP